MGSQWREDGDQERSLWPKLALAAVAVFLACLILLVLASSTR